MGNWRKDKEKLEEDQEARAQEEGEDKSSGVSRLLIIGDPSWLEGE